MNKIKNALKSEFINGRTKFDWIFLGAGIIIQIIAIIYGYLTGTPDSVITIISGLTGIISVVLCAQGKISFYVFGYIQLFTYMFGVAIPCALWGEAIENVFYFVTMVYGTFVWFKNYGKTEKGSTEIKAKTFSKKGWIVSIIALAAGTVVFAFVLMNIHNWLPAIFPEADPNPWLDSLTTVAPFIAQVFLMLGYREQWAFWIIEDVFSLILFISLGSWVMVAQYLFWTINCVYGWIMWTRASKNKTLFKKEN